MLDTKYLMKNPCILNSGEETSQFMNDRTEGRYAIKTLKVRILRFISANGQGEHGCIQLMTMFTHYNSDQGGNLLIILVSHYAIESSVDEDGIMYGAYILQVAG